MARAGPDIAAVQGGSVTLGAEGAEAGQDDPWGTNVAYSWRKTAGAAVTYGTGKGADTARPVFTAPSSDGRLAFRLTVTGRGGAFAASDDAAVQVGPDGTPPVAVSAMVDGEALTLAYGEDLAPASPVPAPGSGPVYIVVLGGSEPARVTGAAAGGRMVTLTLDPPAAYGQAVTLSYYPDNAVEANRVRDAGGTPAGALTGFPVRNATPEGPHVREVAFAGAAGTSGIGDRVAVDVTFSEPVAVTGAPVLALEVGDEARAALWKPGQGTGAVQRFEYAVVEGDLDTDGIAVAKNGLAAPAGSAIRTLPADGAADGAAGEAVILRHGRVSGAAHRVDGVRPVAVSARSEGPSVSVVWDEPLDGAAPPSGGFTVAVPGAANPAVTAVAVTGSVVTLSLDRPIALGTTGVTVRYTPAAAPVRDAAGNAAVAFASPLAVEVARDEAAPTLAAAVVEGDRLTLTWNEPLKVAAPARSGAGAVFAVAVSGGSAFTLSDLRAGAGAGNTEVTMTLEPPAQAGQTVTVAYTAANATAATRVQDLAGNEAASFAAVSALTPAVTVRNRTGAPALTLSKAQVTEGGDAAVTLTLSTGGTAYARARTFTIAAETGGTAAQTEDWTLPAAGVALPAGAREVTATVAIVDDARLEGEETVSFSASLAGAETAAAELTIADDDRAVLVVTGPDGPVTEGQAIALTLRLEPHPDNLADVSAVAADACLADFPVTATLTRSGDTAAALPDSPVLETEHAFPATAFDDCTRELAVSVPARAADGAWAADRALSFALAPKAGSDVRIGAGAALPVTVRDSTPGGPVVTGIAVSPTPPQASAAHAGADTREQFLQVPDGAVHGRDAVLTFTVAFDHAMTVTPHPETGAMPGLALDIFGRERRAAYTGGSGTRELTFAWTVKRGDYDPDGLEVRRIVANGATVRDGQGRDTPPGAFRAKAFPKHLVRGGFFAMWLVLEDGAAREGEPFRVQVHRDGGAGEHAAALVSAVDGAGPGKPRRVTPFSVELHAEDGRGDVDGDWRTGSYPVPVPGDGRTEGQRMLTLRLLGSDGSTAGLQAWYDLRDPVEAAVRVTERGIAAGGPSLSVSWADAEEAAGAELVFEVRLAPPAAGEVTVDFATRDGSATAGEDYVAKTGTLVFAPGEVRKEVAVAVLADSHDEGSETMALVLSRPRGAEIDRVRGIGTIRNRGPLQKAWIGRFGRMVAWQVLDAVEGRMRAAAAPGVEIALAGERIGWSADGGADGDAAARKEEEARQDAARLAGWLRGEIPGSESGAGPGSGSGTGDAREERRRSRAVTPRELLTGSSFAVSGERRGGGLVSFWGRGAASSFDGREGALSLDGEVTSVMLGADWTSGPGPPSAGGAGAGLGPRSGVGSWTAGLVLSHSAGEGGYRGEGPGGRVEAELTGLFPWARHALGDRLEAWGAAGYGQGELTVIPKVAETDRDGAALRAGLDLWMAAAGLRGTLLDGGGDALTLTGKTDAMMVQTASGRGRSSDGGRLEPARATVSRLRLGLEASRPFALGSGPEAGTGSHDPGPGAALTLGLEVGLRHDGGDAETGFGLDLGAGLTLSAPAHGVEAELRGRGLLSHESKGFRERGFSVSLAWRQKPESDRGATLSLAQTVGGTASGGAESLFSRATLDGLAATPGSGSGAGSGSGNDDLKRRRLELKLGYGFPAFGDRFTSTPEAGIEIADSGRGYRLGWRLARTAPAPGILAFDIAAEGLRRERPGSGGGPEHEIGIGFGWRLAGGSGRSFEARVEARRRESANDNAAPEHEVGLRLSARF